LIVMRIFIFVFLVLFYCTKVEDIKLPPFDPLSYLQQNHDSLNINIDTTYFGSDNNEGSYLRFYFQDSCMTIFKIGKSIRVRNTLMDSILAVSSLKIDYVGLDGIKKSDVRVPLRSKYSLLICNDSVTYTLIWMGPLKNEYEVAKANLFLLKNYMACRNKACADSLVDSLGRMCIRNYYGDTTN